MKFFIFITLISYTLSKMISKRVEDKMAFLIKSYNLTYIQGLCYISDSYISQDFTSDLPKRYGEGEKRRFSSNIYNLYNGTDRVMWHILQADETWHYYFGKSMLIYIINPLNGEITTKKVGNKFEDQEADFQVTILHGTLFGAKVEGEDGFYFGSAQTTPGFDFKDSKFIDKKEIELKYPLSKGLL